MLSLEVEAQPVPQETTKNHKTTQRSAVQGETTAARRDGAQQGDCQRTKKQTPEERTTDRNLGAPSPATVSTNSYRSGDTRGEILGKEHQGEDFFFWPVPYALEALTVINTFCFD